MSNSEYVQQFESATERRVITFKVVVNSGKERILFRDVVKCG
jgi:hypothetical protein